MNTVFFEVRGSNAKRRALIEQAAEFCAERLTLGKAIININISGRRLEDDAYGYCDYVAKHNRFHHIDIELYGKLDDAELISTLFHELKHAEQYCVGDLSPCVNVWKGKDYSKSNAYMSLPWEVAARGFERRALNRWYASC